MKSILINASILDSKKTGVVLYSEMIIEGLLKFPIEDVEYFVFVFDLKYVNKFKNANVELIKLPFLLHLIFKKRTSIYRLLWNLLVLPKLANKYDITYSPASYGGIGIKNQIITIHDLICIKYPKQHILQYFYFQLFLPHIIKNAIVVTISEFTKNEVISNFKLKSDNVIVIYNGSDHLSKSINKERKSQIALHNLTPYFITIGASYEHKNIFRLIEVAKKLQNTNHKFVIVGRKNKYFESLIHKVYDEKISNILFFDSISNDDLSLLYSNCVANIYLSLYEGFGFPPIEAALYGKPSVISDIQIFKEIYNQSAIFVNPYDINEIYEKLVNLIEDKNNGISLEFDYGTLVNKYTWINTWNQIIDLFKNNLNHNYKC